jgi:hypothetical protein
VLRSSRTEASSLHRHYPASPVLQASPSPQAARPVPRGRPVAQPSQARLGASRVARVFLVYMLSPIPRHSAWVPLCSITPAVSVFPGSSAGSTCAFSFSRLARRSLALRPAHSRRHQSRDALHQRLRLLRYLHSRSGCFRLEHSPGGTLTHWKTPPFHGAPACWKVLTAVTGRLRSQGIRQSIGK